MLPIIKKSSTLGQSKTVFLVDILGLYIGWGIPLDATTTAKTNETEFQHNHQTDISLFLSEYHAYKWSIFFISVTQHPHNTPEIFIRNSFNNVDEDVDDVMFGILIHFSI